MPINLIYKNTILNISLYKGNEKPITEIDDEFFNEIFNTVVEERSAIEKEIIKNPLFKYSLEPIQNDAENTQEIIKKMYYAASVANVGLMATVAGAIAEILCKKCIEHGFDAGIIENGGDIALFGDRNFKVKIYARNSIFSNKFYISLNPAIFPDKILGVCTSSSSVGPSISFGDSDAITVIANSPTIADAFATSLGNMVKNDKKSIEEVIEFGKKFKEIYGICIIVKDKIGVWNVNIEKIYG